MTRLQQPVLRAIVSSAIVNDATSITRTLATDPHCSIAASHWRDLFYLFRNGRILSPMIQGTKMSGCDESSGIRRSRTLAAPCFWLCALVACGQLAG